MYNVPSIETMEVKSMMLMTDPSFQPGTTGDELDGD